MYDNESIDANEAFSDLRVSILSCTKLPWLICVFSNGWCATCDPDAKRGQPNYCGPDMATVCTQIQNEIIFGLWTPFQNPKHPRFYKEMAIASPGKNWGFCSDECKDMNDPYKYTVAFTGLGLMAYLPDERCEDLLNNVRKLRWKCSPFILTSFWVDRNTSILKTNFVVEMSSMMRDVVSKWKASKISKKSTRWFHGWIWLILDQWIWEQRFVG